MPEPLLDLAIDPADPTHLVASGEAALLRSSTWQTSSGRCSRASRSGPRRHRRTTHPDRARARPRTRARAGGRPGPNRCSHSNHHRRERNGGQAPRWGPTLGEPPEAPPTFCRHLDVLDRPQTPSAPLHALCLLHKTPVRVFSEGSVHAHDHNDDQRHRSAGDVT